MNKSVESFWSRAGIVAWVAALVLAVTACGGGNDQPLIAPPGAEPGQLVNTTVRSTAPQLPAGTTTKLVRYRMEAVSGELTEATALMFTPPGGPPPGGWPLAVWTHGTTGVADSCSPSRFPLYADASEVAPLLAQGMAVLAPDYEGLGTPGVHPYYIRQSHSLSVLRAVQAVMTDPGLQLAPRWSVIGHSQGGNVALAAAEDSAKIAGVSKLQAVVLLAPGSDLVGTSDELFRQIDALEAQGEVERAGLLMLYLNFNGSLVLHGAKAAHPTINVPSYFGRRMQPLLDLALNEPLCGAFFAAVVLDIRAWAAAGNTIASYPGLRRDWHTEPAIAQIMADNRVGNVRVDAPVRVVQGTSDEQVPLAATQRLVANMRLAGSNVVLTEIPDGNHSSVVSDVVLNEAAIFLRSQLGAP